MRQSLLLREYSRKIGTQVACGDAGGILDCAQTLVRNTILIPTRYRALIDPKLFSQVDEAKTAIFQEIGKRHAGLVAQLTTEVNCLG